MNLRDHELLFTNALHPNASNDIFSDACDLLIDQGSLSTEDRLLVYRHNVSGGYISALASTFVVCEKILGKACFAAFARDYAWNKITQTNNLNELGEAFPAHIEYEINHRDGFENYAYLPDMATFEWLVERSIQANDTDLTSVIAAEQLETQDPEHIYPIVNSALFLLMTDYPILQLWKKHKDDDDVTSIAGLDESAYLCVCRDENDDAIIQSINKTHFYILEKSQTESLNSLAFSFPTQLTNFLQHSLEQGWLQGFRR